MRPVPSASLSSSAHVASLSPFLSPEEASNPQEEFSLFSVEDFDFGQTIPSPPPQPVLFSPSLFDFVSSTPPSSPTPAPLSVVEEPVIFFSPCLFAFLPSPLLNHFLPVDEPLSPLLLPQTLEEILYIPLTDEEIALQEIIDEDIEMSPPPTPSASPIYLVPIDDPMDIDEYEVNGDYMDIDY
ncbi:hypothetical protein BDB01DRAFT_855347 [Pilobolus umbonatus]|nr:hypothetical protein BDB01DRAFT_855347 [Pilobolus umbonatus]